MKFETNYYRVKKQGFATTGETLTEQSHKQACDINYIVKRSYKGLPVPVNPMQGDYGDFSDAPTYQEALNTVKIAEDNFLELSATTRKRFGNDPKQFLEFIHNKDNIDEMIKLGLAKKPITTPIPGEKVENQKT